MKSPALITLLWLPFLAGCPNSIETSGSGGSMTQSGGAGGTITTASNGGAGGTVTTSTGGMMTTASSGGAGGTTSSSSSSTGGDGGAPIACATLADCPGVDTDCQHRACTAGQCAVAFEPLGTPLPAQTDGDCHLAICDGAGAPIAVSDDGDVLADDNPCTADVCNAGMLQHPALPAGTSCSGSNGTKCDGNGACVECIADTNCPAGVCWMGHCPALPCADGVKDGTETDTDCGGSCPNKCEIGQHCLSDNDCYSHWCLGGSCIHLDGCSDFVKDGTETDTDCGGPICIPCGAGLKCLGNWDCGSHICNGGVCAAATCKDGVENGLETDVDCGGGCSPCLVGNKCKVGSDCQSGVCSGSLCQP
ncbi:Hypothetical protein A7982_07300 [Minicystis rosea]|nr:Hypothetical protein A7982_07300 [Minicystis rosea]